MWYKKSNWILEKSLTCTLLFPHSHGLTHILDYRRFFQLGSDHLAQLTERKSLLNKSVHIHDISTGTHLIFLYNLVQISTYENHEFIFRNNNAFKKIQLWKLLTISFLSKMLFAIIFHCFSWLLTCNLTPDL